MKKSVNWMKRLFVGAVAVATLGIVSPNHEIWSTWLENSEERANTSTSKETRIEEPAYDLYWPEEQLVQDEPTNQLYENVYADAYSKFGEKIGPVLQPIFDEEIFPAMKRAVEETHDRTQLSHLIIASKPSGHYGERIVHLQDKRTNQPTFYFHVRTENRPKDGYYYNFHYHTKNDQFEEHHTLATVFWSKNTPPKWRA